MVEQFEKLGKIIINYIHQAAHINDFPDMVRNWMLENNAIIERFFTSGDMGEAL